MMVKTEEHTPIKKGHQNSYPYDSSILASFIINHNLDIKKKRKRTEQNGCKFVFTSKSNMLKL
jgi:hypothetical protein